MKWLVVVMAVCGVGAIVLYSQLPFLRTLYLIIRVQPYEQAPTNASGHIHVLGDSTGYGTGATRAQHSVAGQLGTRYLDYRLSNDSVNGRTLSEGVTALQATQFVAPPQLLLLQLGGNDILGSQTPEAIKPQLEALLTLAREKAERVVLMAAGNVGGAPRFYGTQATHFQERSKQFDAMFRRVAAAQEVTFVSLYEAPTVDPFVSAPEEYIALDGLHPSNQGYAYWYEKLQAALPESLSS